MNPLKKAFDEQFERFELSGQNVQHSVHQKLHKRKRKVYCQVLALVIIMMTIAAILLLTGRGDQIQVDELLHIEEIETLQGGLLLEITAEHQDEFDALYTRSNQRRYAKDNI